MGYEKKKKRKKATAAEPYSDEEWEVRGDLEAIARAEAVRKDPDRMAKVKALAAKRLEENKRRQEEANTLVDLGEGKDI